MNEPGDPSRRVRHGDAYSLWWFCPGCALHHRVPVQSQTEKPWTWNGSTTRPTLTPSVLVWSRQDRSDQCHCFLRDGRIEFLADSRHVLAGQTIDLPPFDDDLSLGDQT